MYSLCFLLCAFAEKPAMSDEEILARIYDKAFRAPKGFVEDHAIADKNKSLYYHQPGWFAGDKAAAKKIVQDFLDKPSNIAVRKIEEEKESPRSFDFRGGTIWYRIHKSDWFAWREKSIAETWLLGNPDAPLNLGTMKLKEITAAAVRQFAEYDWLIQHYNIGGYKVLASEAKEAGGKVVATLLTTQTVFGDFGLRDEIKVVPIVWTVDRKTGATTREIKKERTILGKKN